jgi:ParB family chromosome partitioning protein
MSIDARRTVGGLGRGLAALIPPGEPAASPAEGSTEGPSRNILIADIRRNPYQPRQQFDDAELEELTSSIMQHGVLQPILVTEIEGGYQVIAGERRLRAAEAAGLERIPATVRTADRQQQLALALVENIQRSDLNAMDEARAFHQLMVEFGLTQEEVGFRVGRSRPAVANTLRLLEVSPTLQRAVEQGTVSEGHARALAGLPDHNVQDDVLDVVVGRGLSVRATEDLVRSLREGAAAPAAQMRAVELDPDIERIEAGLRTALATRVSVSPGRKGGRISITYYDADDLARIYERLTGGER